MATVVGPLPPSQWPPELRPILSIYPAAGALIARWRGIPPTPNSPEQIDLQRRIRAAAQSWRSIAAWKRARWALCALSRYGDLSAWVNAPGLSGYTLYILSWLDQGTEPPQQPISPCARRLTDPAASPWDYTP